MWYNIQQRSLHHENTARCNVYGTDGRQRPATIGEAVCQRQPDYHPRPRILRGFLLPPRGGSGTVGAPETCPRREERNLGEVSGGSGSHPHPHPHPHHGRQVRGDMGPLNPSGNGATRERQQKVASFPNGDWISAEGGKASFSSHGWARIPDFPRHTPSPGGIRDRGGRRGGGPRVLSFPGRVNTPRPGGWR